MERVLPTLDPTLLRRHLGDRFDILEPLGSGASGSVYRAITQIELDGVPAGAEVALKVLRPELAADPEARARLIREGELGRGIEDRHVVRIHGSGEVDGGGDGPFLYLVTGFVRGRTLRDLLRDAGPVVGDLARRIGEQAALGLAALHEAGIVHGDVKPENLLIADDGAELRLADLGLARSAGERGPHGSSGGFHGSLAYAAPELLRGQPASFASDLYALGIVLFEVVTGKHPFADAGNPDQVLYAKLFAPPPRVSHLQPRASAFLEAAIADLLEKDPARRPADARSVAQTFAAAESSPYWRARERVAPVLASRRRLLAMRRSRFTAFVDREAEQRVLDGLLASAVAGRGQAILVRGHGGSGRRRLVDECVDRWLDRHADLVFLGGIAEDEPTSRLGTPFPQLLVDALLEGDDESSPRALERLQARLEGGGELDAQDARHLAEICTADPGQIALTPAARADLLVRGIVQVARRAAGGLVLRVDRCEGLGAAGRLVVQRLIDRVHELPLLLVLVGRSFGDAPFEGHELVVQGLAKEPFVELGGALFRSGEAPEDLIRAAWVPLSGQPRALLESLEELTLQGALAGRPGDFHELAPTVRELRPARPALQRLRDRVQTVPQVHRHVLQAAAVLGNRFDVLDLAALTGRPELEVLESLAAFDNRIVGVDRGRGRFRHREYRLATIASTPEEARRRLHRDAAWVLEDRGAPALEVGLHLSRALEDQACVEPLLIGLEELVRTNARKAALRVSERLHLHLNRLPRSPANLGRRLRWLLLSGDAWAAAGDEGKSARAFRKAILIARHLEFTAERAHAMVGLADLAQHKGRFWSAIQLLTQAEGLLEGAQGERERRVHARALLVHARVMAYQGQSLDALSLTNAALRELPPGEDTLEAHLRVDQARWLALRLRFGRALLSLERAQRLAANGDDPLADVRVHLHRGRTLGALGELAAAEQDLERAHEIAKRLGDDRMRGRARLFRAELDAYSGDGIAARPLLLEARRGALRSGDRVTLAIADALLAVGELDDLAPREVPVHGVPVADIASLLAEGVRRRRAGDDRAARAFLRQASAIERRARVPFLMRIALLRAAGREEIAARLIRAIAARRSPGSARRTFLAFAERVRL